MFFRKAEFKRAGAIEISRENLAAQCSPTPRPAAEGCELMPVLKANAYGHGQR